MLLRSSTINTFGKDMNPSLFLPDIGKTEQLLSFYKDGFATRVDMPVEMMKLN